MYLGVAAGAEVGEDAVERVEGSGDGGRANVTVGLRGGCHCHALPKP